jgi:hypothetical protein
MKLCVLLLKRIDMKRLFLWLDGVGKLSPLEKAEIEYQQTQEALLEALSNEEHYNSLVKTLKAREKRLSSYLGV